ncbi:MAG: hypothetical protein IPI59_09235 [Sphingobacteriales bacterium]|nr:hypothetical protein [Sphingobacteriales bacterium]MBK7527716.1 hypothetical protein [Sphingobacteriales bacterium]MBP9142704.1 hypothetical protein [Chitinophagales bacterium]MDA0198866.1 hypothetical protein [Bacteroidota bacterium]
MFRFFVLMLMICLIVSCKKITQIEDLRHNIVGEWDIEQIFHEIRADTVYFEYKYTKTITFNDNGTGSQLNQSTNNLEEFDWLYQYDPEIVMMIFPDVYGLNYRPVQMNKVIYNSPIAQVWEFEFEDPKLIADILRYKWNMTKK